MQSRPSDNQPMVEILWTETVSALNKSQLSVIELTAPDHLLHLNGPTMAARTDRSDAPLEQRRTRPSPIPHSQT
jgi:hypothetical protein